MTSTTIEQQTAALFAGKTPADFTAEELTPIRYVRYKPDGTIFDMASTSAIIVTTWLNLGEPLVIGDGHWDTHYVDVATASIQPKQPSTARLKGLVISGLVNPSRVTVEGTTHDITDTTLELSFDQPGLYDVRIETVTQLTTTLKVTANG